MNSIKWKLIDKRHQNEYGMDGYFDHYRSRHWCTLNFALHDQHLLQFVPQEGHRRWWKQFGSSSRVNKWQTKNFNLWFSKSKHVILKFYRQIPFRRLWVQCDAVRTWVNLFLKFGFTLLTGKKLFSSFFFVFVCTDFESAIQISHEKPTGYSKAVSKGYGQDWFW